MDRQTALTLSLHGTWSRPDPAGSQIRQLCFKIRHLRIQIRHVKLEIRHLYMQIRHPQPLISNNFYYFSAGLLTRDSRLGLESRLESLFSDSRLDSWLGPPDSRLDSRLGPLTRPSHGRVTVESQLTFILPTYLLYTLFTNWGPNGTPGRSFRYHSLTVGILGKHFDKLWCIWTVYKMVQQIFFSTAHKSNMAAKTWIFSWKIT